MWCIFRFSNSFSLFFFWNCGYLFCLTYKNKKAMKEQRVKRQRKKKIIFNSKKEFVRGHSFMTSAKKSKFRATTHLFPSNFQFWSKQIPLLDVLNPHPTPHPLPNPQPSLWIISYSFFIANAYSICYSHMYHKTERKAYSFPLIRHLWKAIVPYRTTSQVQKKFQDGNSVIGKQKV